MFLPLEKLFVFFFPFGGLTSNDPQNHQRLFLLEAGASSPNTECSEVDFLGYASVPFQTDSSVSSRSGCRGLKDIISLVPFGYIVNMIGS